MSQKKLPADPLSLILGIIALLLTIGTCCISVMLFPFGIVAILPLLISIIGVIVANRSLKLYRKNPELYSESSKNNVRTGRVINVIVMLFSAISFISLIVYFIFIGKSFVGGYNQVGTFESYENYTKDNDAEIKMDVDTINDNIEEEILDTVIIESEDTE